MSYPFFASLVAKVARRLGISKYLDLVLRVSTMSGEIKIPLQRGTAEFLIASAQGGFKSDICQLLHSAGQTLLELYGAGLEISNYYGFEPNISSMAIAERLVKLNPLFRNVSLMPWACASQDRPFRLYAISEIDSGATIDPSIRPDWYTQMQGSCCSAYRLDSVNSEMALCANFFLKIDVEGGELEVLQGATQILAEWRPIIQCEVLHAHRPSEIDYNIQHKCRLLSLLRCHGYQIFICHLAQGGKSLLRLQELSKFPVNVYKNSPNTCDFLFLPNELCAFMGD
jgi:FkbM family methyltransferase